MTTDYKINELIDIVQVLAYHTPLNKRDCDNIVRWLQTLKEEETE